MPVWSPDGSRIAFVSGRGGVSYLFEKISSGASDEAPLLQSSEPKYLYDWSRDGRFLLYSSVDPQTGFDLWVLPLSGDRKPSPFLKTRFRESQGQFSPDSRWIAYVSDESGAPEIYVRPFGPSSGSSGKWQISSGGGSGPRWRRDGQELFYFSGRKLMSVEVTAGPGFQAGVLKPLFEATVVAGGSNLDYHYWDVTADGKRFLINTQATESASAPITVVVNWAAGLKK
jgi:eukaryotic-like serine/threonine-protein kinase